MEWHLIARRTLQLWESSLFKCLIMPPSTCTLMCTLLFKTEWRLGLSCKLGCISAHPINSILKIQTEELQLARIQRSVKHIEFSSKQILVKIHLLTVVTCLICTVAFRRPQTKKLFSMTYSLAKTFSGKYQILTIFLMAIHSHSDLSFFDQTFMCFLKSLKDFYLKKGRLSLQISLFLDYL